MWIDSSGDIKDINCGFIYPDGSFYGTDDYRRGYYTHDKVLDHFGIKEEPGVIRFCLSFIMLESGRYIKGVILPPEYRINSITAVQSILLRKWMSKLQGNIGCPTIHDKWYQVRYLESLDDKLLTNIISL